MKGTVVQGRGFFASEEDIRGWEPPKDTGELYELVTTATSNLEGAVHDAEFFCPIFGSIVGLVLAGYKDLRIKKIIKPYAMWLAGTIANDPASPLINRFQKMLYYIYHEHPGDPGADAMMVAQVHSIDLTKKLFEEIVKEHGGQEELDKVHRALDGGKIHEVDPREKSTPTLLISEG